MGISLHNSSDQRLQDIPQCSHDFPSAQYLQGECNFPTAEKHFSAALRAREVLLSIGNLTRRLPCWMHCESLQWKTPFYRSFWYILGRMHIGNLYLIWITEPGLFEGKWFLPNLPLERDDCIFLSQHLRRDISCLNLLDLVCIWFLEMTKRNWHVNDPPGPKVV